MPRPISEEEKNRWKDRILKQRESGLSIPSWCRQNHIEVPTFYYWRDKLFPKETFKRSAFKEIKSDIPIKSTGIFLECQEIRIHLECGFDSLTLQRCLKTLKEMPC